MFGSKGPSMNTSSLVGTIGFFSSRLNRDPPPPAPSPPATSLSPPLLVAGGDTLARGRGGAQFGRGDRHSGTLGMYFVVWGEFTSFKRKVVLSKQLHICIWYTTCQTLEDNAFFVSVHYCILYFTVQVPSLMHKIAH